MRGYRPPKDLSLRLLSRVRRSKSGCLEWQGSVNTDGYGTLGVGSRTDKTRRTVLAHRASYSIFVGPIPEGTDVLHHCDNPPCILPRHLFLGTQADNNADRDAKGRNIVLHGSRIGTSKLNEKTVGKIKRRLGYRNDGKLAREFGVSDSQIFNIRHGLAWRRV